MRLNVKAMAAAAGLLWGLGIFLGTWWMILFDGATGEVTMLGRLYRGFSISTGGSFIGLVWGLADGAAAGAILAWLYNAFAKRLPERRAAD